MGYGIKIECCSIHLMLWNAHGSGRIIIMQRYTRKGRAGKGTGDTDPETVGGHVGKAKNALIADTGCRSYLFPLSVNPGIQLMFFHALPMRSQRFL